MRTYQIRPEAPPPYDRVVFDCDSTLSSIEGIEELAAGRPELRDEIAALTDQAMSGAIPLEQVYARRLELLAPRRVEVAQIGRLYMETALPHAREVVSLLHALDKEVRVVSGGLMLAVQPFAAWLGVRAERVHAVPIRFDVNEHYLAVDESCPLARAGGKRELVASWPALSTVMVGDGMTDAEVAPAVSAFVCFAGVVERPAVAELAHAVVRRPDLAALLPALLSADELERIRRDPRHRPLLAHA